MDEVKHTTSVTRSGDLLDFDQLFKAFGLQHIQSNIFDVIDTVHIQFGSC